MKKLVSLLLALMLALFSVSALADQKVTVDFNLDKELATAVASMSGSSEVSGAIDSVVGLVNAIQLNVVVGDNGAELSLDLENGGHLATVGCVANESGLVVGSDVIPSYLLTVSPETIQQLVQQLTAQMPNLQNLDLNALMNSLGQYVGKFTTALQGAIVPGTPETVTFAAEGYNFDTKTPVDVNIKAILEAAKTLVADVTNDAAIASVLQTIDQNGDVRQSLQQFQEMNLDELSMPDLKVDMYTSTADTGIFYLDGSAAPQGQDPAFLFNLLGYGDGGKLTLTVPEGNQTITVSFGSNGFALEVNANGMYAALKGEIKADGLKLDVYFINTEKALATVDITVSNNGSMTLDLNPANKTVISVEDLQANKVDQTVMQGLAQEAQQKAISAMMALMAAVPEAGSLLTTIMPH